MLVPDTSIPDPQLLSLSHLTVGFVAADLKLLVRVAATIAHPAPIEYSHLVLALDTTPPSALRESMLLQSQTTHWDEIGGDAGGAKQELRRAVEWPVQKEAQFKKLDLRPPRGILLYGPPGCAKTTLARACASSSSIGFVSLSPADVYAAPYVGDAEAVIRKAFKLARSVAPCVLFFDEIDCVVGAGDAKTTRGDGKSAEARVLSTFLNEMDGVDIDGDDGVLVLGATNRPSVLDSALLRAGRFDKQIYVGAPDAVGREQIWGIHVKNEGVSELLDFAKLGRMSEGFTGAEIEGCCREGLMSIVARDIEERVEGGGEEGGIGGREEIMGYFEAAVGLTNPIMNRISTEHSDWEVFRRNRERHNG